MLLGAEDERVGKACRKRFIRVTVRKRVVTLVNPEILGYKIPQVIITLSLWCLWKHPGNTVSLASLVLMNKYSLMGNHVLDTACFKQMENISKQNSLSNELIF